MSSKLDANFFIVYILVLAAPLVVSYLIVRLAKKIERVSIKELFLKLIPWQLIVLLAYLIPIVTFLFLQQKEHRLLWIIGCYLYWWIILANLEPDPRRSSDKSKPYIEALFPFALCFIAALVIRVIQKSGSSFGIEDCIPIDRFGSMKCF